MIKKLFVASFVVFLFIPSTLLIFKLSKDSVSYEKRDLALLPQLFGIRKASFLDAVKQFPTEFEAYLKDNLPYRNVIVGNTNLKKLEIFAQSPTEKIHAGKDGMYFYNDANFFEIGEAKKLFSQNELENWGKALVQRRDHAKANGADYLVIITPIKATIYPENLNNNYSIKVADYKKSDQLVEYIQKNTDIKINYLKDELQTAKIEQSKNLQNPYLFYRTDSHWNSFGAKVGFEAIAKMTKIPLSLDKFELNYANNSIGDLSLILGLGTLLPERNNPQFKYKESDELSYTSKADGGPIGIEVFDGSKASTVEYKSTKSSVNNNKIVLFRSSYVDYMEQFFGYNFGEAYFYKMPVQYDAKKVEKHKPNLVIQEFSEQSLVEVPVVFNP